MLSAARHIPQWLVVKRVFPFQKKTTVCGLVGFAPFDMASPGVLPVTIQVLAVLVRGWTNLDGAIPCQGFYGLAILWLLRGQRESRTPNLLIIAVLPLNYLSRRDVKLIRLTSLGRFLRRVTNSVSIS